MWGEQTDGTRWDLMAEQTLQRKRGRERERGEDAGERFAPDTVLRQTDKRAGSVSSHHENRSCCSPLAQSCPSSPAGQGLQSALHSPLVPTPQTGSWWRGSGQQDKRAREVSRGRGLLGLQELLLVVGVCLSASSPLRVPGWAGPSLLSGSHREVQEMVQ